MDPATARLTALLAPLTNYERTRPDRPRWSLDNTRALLSRPGFTLSGSRRVQIGGSKGKGTAALYLARLADDAGLRSGVYLSPHLESLMERVSIGGDPVDEPALRGALDGLLEFAAARDLEPSFFEIMTAAALTCFAEHRLDLEILEVGLGGRLDATTAAPVDASLLTGVELEHTQLLGDTVAEIASEKSHVIRADRPAFVSAEGPALAVFEQRAAEVGARLFVLGQDFAVESEPRPDGFEGVVRTPRGAELPFALPGASAFELPALALAVACMEELWPDVTPALAPVARPSLPGRCEVFRCGDGAPLVLDGAHTEASMQSLAGELRRRFPGRSTTALFGVAAGKRWRESLEGLLPACQSFLVTGLADTASEDPAEIVDWLRAKGAAAEEVPDPAAGLRRLGGHPGVRLVTGSFYLVGAARTDREILGATGSW